jgi:hypothetical protein
MGSLRFEGAYRIDPNDLRSCPPVSRGSSRAGQAAKVAMARGGQALPWTPPSPAATVTARSGREIRAWGAQTRKKTILLAHGPARTSWRASVVHRPVGRRCWQGTTPRLRRGLRTSRGSESSGERQAAYSFMALEGLPVVIRRRTASAFIVRGADGSSNRAVTVLLAVDGAALLPSR